MPAFKCECSPGEEITVSSCTIKFVAGKGIVHDVSCKNCKEFMELAYPKDGECAGFSSNDMGQL
jgi:hypothetical protein